MTASTFFRRYFVHCGTQWSDDAECMCNDRCPVCNHEIEPYSAAENGEELELLVENDFVPEGGLPTGCENVGDLDGWPADVPFYSQPIIL